MRALLSCHACGSLALCSHASPRARGTDAPAADDARRLADMPGAGKPAVPADVERLPGRVERGAREERSADQGRDLGHDRQPERQDREHLHPRCVERDDDAAQLSRREGAYDAAERPVLEPARRREREPVDLRQRGVGPDRPHDHRRRRLLRAAGDRLHRAERHRRLLDARGRWLVRRARRLSPARPARRSWCSTSTAR